MQLSVFKANGRNLARGCAMVLVIGAVSGCSSQVARFGGVDDFATASTSNQRSIIEKQAPQPYPGDVAQAAPAASPAPANGSYSQSVTRSSLEPVSVKPLPPVAQAEPAPASKPIRTAVAAPRLDSTTTGTVASTKPFKQAAPEEPQMASADSEPHGWSRAGGTQITAKEGETVYNLSRRFGVPADVIMKTNGLSSANGLQVGQKVVIPTYVYSSKAPVSAPDSDPNVADAKSSRGTKYDVPANKVPLPANAPVQKVAVLPQQPKLKEGQAETAAGNTAPASDPKQKPAKQVAEASQPGTYKVQSGDTLSAVARKTGVSVTALKQANGMQDGILRIGQTLKVPSAGETTTVSAAKPAALDPVKTASTPPPEKATQTLASYTPPKQDAKVIQQAEKEAVDAPDSTGIGKMRWPVRGRVISGFGGKGGDGIDIAVPEGTPVKAAENGVVIYAGNGLKEFGNTVLVRHDNGLVTVYGHASNIEVQRGQKVKRGQEIAQSGMSGTTDSPKLHFEVRKNSAPIDPSTFLE